MNYGCDLAIFLFYRGPAINIKPGHFPIELKVVACVLVPLEKQLFRNLHLSVLLWYFLEELIFTHALDNIALLRNVCRSL